ncbi:MAG: tetratricopeptide repeat protein [Alphaproteobacteria bacterium]|nr:tetratricopeptide repeat protein [Alphaproteobacteria bacterium]
MDEIELNALNFLKNKEYDKAANLYLKLALKYPSTEKYFITAANCYDAIGDKKTALSLYKKALEINPDSTTALLNISTIYYEIKKYEKALKFSNKVLETKPDNFSALLNIANTYYANKEYNEALKFYEKLYELNPNSYNAIANIANTCYNLNQFIRAIEFSKMAIEMRPNSVEPYIVAGNSYAELLKKDDAAILLKKAASIAPNSEWVCNSIASLFMKMGNYKQGLGYAWRLFSLKNNITADDHINFGYILYEAHDEKQTQLVDHYLTLWEEKYPQNPIVHHICCALRNVQEVQTSDLEYVKTLFDGFAPSFDNILTELDYSVPQSIAEFLKENLKTKLFKKQQILDIGCGTGLCSEELKKIFPNEEYYGVDISEKMLNEAGKKNIYKELYQDDISNFLTKNTTKYQTIIAGDVLTYMGDLKPLTRLLAKSISFNGYLCFSISKNTYNKNEYFLTPSGRFVHNISYVMRQLKHCGFEVIKTEEKVLRREGAKDVIGYIILVKKELEVVFE